jgi:hypothetical protein
MPTKSYILTPFCLRDHNIKVDLKVFLLYAKGRQQSFGGLKKPFFGVGIDCWSLQSRS